MIREYDPSHDRAGLRDCVIELQEYERTIDPALPEGERMADAYVAFLLERCAKLAGRVFVLDADRQVIGFVSVMTQVPPEEPGEERAEYAYVSDLVVLPAHRGRGFGRALLERAETFAREQGARMLKVGVLAGNRPARRLYHEMGFADHQIQLVKRF